MQSSSRQESEIAAFITATFFLVAPIVVMLIFAERAHRSPQGKWSGAVGEEEEYQRAVQAVIKAQSSPAALGLVSVNFSEPVKVVTWMGHEEAKPYGEKTTRTLKDWSEPQK
jgi:hypothetical protein